MDLFLMDWVLKGRIPPEGTVLDVGCGEGRNSVYFLQGNYQYTGFDSDPSKIALAQYMSNGISSANATFLEVDFQSFDSKSTLFDLIICSRFLHFSEGERDFFQQWEKIESLLAPEGIAYVCMDSVIDTSLGSELKNGKYEFPDGQLRFALTPQIYGQMKQGFSEVEPLRTLVHHQARAQSFMLLRKG